MERHFGFAAGIFGSSRGGLLT